MTLPIAYGLVAQALIAAAIVRLLIDLTLRRANAPAPTDAPNGNNAQAAPGAVAPRGGDLPIGTPWAVMAGPLVLLVPIGGSTIAEHMRGIWGDPSIVTCALLAIFVARPGRLPSRPSRAMCVGLTLLVTLPLYGPVFGLSLPIPDLYALGWRVHALLLAIACAAGLSWIINRWCGTWVLIVAIALMAYAAGLMESSNLIDYLADPGLLLSIAAMAALPRPHMARPR